MPYRRAADQKSGLVTGEADRYALCAAKGGGHLAGGSQHRRCILLLCGSLRERTWSCFVGEAEWLAPRVHLRGTTLCVSEHRYYGTKIDDSQSRDRLQKIPQTKTQTKRKF
jgi:hypothetical protein